MQSYLGNCFVLKSNTEMSLLAVKLSAGDPMLLKKTST